MVGIPEATPVFQNSAAPGEGTPGGIDLATDARRRFWQVALSFFLDKQYDIHISTMNFNNYDLQIS